MDWHLIVHLLNLFVPFGLVTVALLNDKKAHWNLAILFSGLGVLVSLILGVAHLFDFMEINSTMWVIPTPASIVMMGLVSVIGLVNVLFSKVYMSGNQEDERRYLTWLMLTLSAVIMAVITNHMLVLVISWYLINYGLHRLLLFFPNRQRAALAAHKKFIFSRVSEALLLAAVLLLYYQHGTWFISEIRNVWFGTETFTQLDKTAAILLVASAIVTCAQLPFHGWLIQVVEAPTPVSALLHAGIVNLGGYLLILFAPAIMASDFAQWLLLIVGGLTTVLAALVMMTRASIKVRLAWSTVSQMGLMLVECGLGLFNLALLHLLAHSFYKAYSFLNSGSEVHLHLIRREFPLNASSISDWMIAVSMSFLMILFILLFMNEQGPYSPWFLLGVAITLLIAERYGEKNSVSLIYMVLLGVILIIAYYVQKLIIGMVAPKLVPSVGLMGDIWVFILVIFLVLGYWLMRNHATAPWFARFRRALYAGFYLDEWVTRITLRLYPIDLPVWTKPKKLHVPKEEFIINDSK